jgi:hypothetical protein
MQLPRPPQGSGLMAVRLSVAGFGNGSIDFQRLLADINSPLDVRRKPRIRGVFQVKGTPVINVQKSQSTTPAAPKFTCDDGKQNLGGCSCLCAPYSINMGQHCRNRARGCNVL